MNIRNIFLAICLALAVPAHAEVLQGQVSETVGPVPAQFLPGQPYSTPNLSPKIIGFAPVPDWFAGTFHGTELDGKPCNATITTADQVDGMGQKYAALIAPYESVIDYGYAKVITLHLVPLQTEIVNGSYRSKATGINIEVRKGKIKRTWQSVDCETYYPANGMIQSERTSITYNEKGDPVERHNILGRGYVTPFQPVNEYNGIDIRQAFCDFIFSRK